MYTDISKLLEDMRGLQVHARLSREPNSTGARSAMPIASSMRTGAIRRSSHLVMRRAINRDCRSNDRH
jgi:hypothetical protein